MLSHEKKQPPTTQCPTCGTHLKWSTENPHRPFCSEQCRNRDFINWANEDNRIAGNTSYDDVISGDLIINPEY